MSGIIGIMGIRTPAPKPSSIARHRLFPEVTVDRVELG